MPTAPRTMLATPKPTSTTDSRRRLHRILRLEHILPRASLQLQQEETDRGQGESASVSPEGGSDLLLHNPDYMRCYRNKDKSECKGKLEQLTVDATLNWRQRIPGSVVGCCLEDESAPHGKFMRSVMRVFAAWRCPRHLKTHTHTFTDLCVPHM